ncbi:hypothetical protein KKB40_04345 [Patescibacteria group bacterium]|nr:hypothetical protein [Patescibacteria group bacterium]
MSETGRGTPKEYAVVIAPKTETTSAVETSEDGLHSVFEGVRGELILKGRAEIKLDVKQSEQLISEAIGAQAKVISPENDLHEYEVTIQARDEVGERGDQSALQVFNSDLMGLWAAPHYDDDNIDPIENRLMGDGLGNALAERIRDQTGVSKKVRISMQIGDDGELNIVFGSKLAEFGKKAEQVGVDTAWKFAGKIDDVAPVVKDEFRGLGRELIQPAKELLDEAKSELRVKAHEVKEKVEQKVVDTTWKVAGEIDDISGDMKELAREAKGEVSEAKRQIGEVARENIKGVGDDLADGVEDIVGDMVESARETGRQIGRVAGEKAREFGEGLAEDVEKLGEQYDDVRHGLKVLKEDVATPALEAAKWEARRLKEEVGEEWEKRKKERARTIDVGPGEQREVLVATFKASLTDGDSDVAQTYRAALQSSENLSDPAELNKLAASLDALHKQMGEEGYMPKIDTKGMDDDAKQAAIEGQIVADFKGVVGKLTKHTLEEYDKAEAAFSLLEAPTNEALLSGNLSRKEARGVVYELADAREKYRRVAVRTAKAVGGEKDGRALAQGVEASLQKEWEYTEEEPRSFSEASLGEKMVDEGKAQAVEALKVQLERDGASTLFGGIRLEKQKELLANVAAIDYEIGVEKRNLHRALNTKPNELCAVYSGIRSLQLQRTMEIANVRVKLAEAQYEKRKGERENIKNRTDLTKRQMRVANRIAGQDIRSLKATLRREKGRQALTGLSGVHNLGEQKMESARRGGRWTREHSLELVADVVHSAKDKLKEVWEWAGNWDARVEGEKERKMIVLKGGYLKERRARERLWREAKLKLAAPSEKRKKVKEAKRATLGGGKAEKLTAKAEARGASDRELVDGIAKVRDDFFRKDLESRVRLITGEKETEPVVLPEDWDGEQIGLACVKQERKIGFRYEIVGGQLIRIEIGEKDSEGKQPPLKRTRNDIEDTTEARRLIENDIASLVEAGFKVSLAGSRDDEEQASPPTPASSDAHPRPRARRSDQRRSSPAPTPPPREDEPPPVAEHPQPVLSPEKQWQQELDELRREIKEAEGNAAVEMGDWGTAGDLKAKLKKLEERGPDVEEGQEKVVVGSPPTATQTIIPRRKKRDGERTTPPPKPTAPPPKIVSAEPKEEASKSLTDSERLQLALEKARQDVGGAEQELLRANSGNRAKLERLRNLAKLSLQKAELVLQTHEGREHQKVVRRIQDRTRKNRYGWDVDEDTRREAEMGLRKDGGADAEPLTREKSLGEARSEIGNMKYHLDRVQEYGRDEFIPEAKELLESAKGALARIREGETDLEREKEGREARLAVVTTVTNVRLWRLGNGEGESLEKAQEGLRNARADYETWKQGGKTVESTLEAGQEEGISREQLMGMVKKGAVENRDSLNRIFNGDKEVMEIIQLTEVDRKIGLVRRDSAIPDEGYTNLGFVPLGGNDPQKPKEKEVLSKYSPDDVAVCVAYHSVNTDRHSRSGSFTAVVIMSKEDTTKFAKEAERNPASIYDLLRIVNNKPIEREDGSPMDIRPGANVNIKTLRYNPDGGYGVQETISRPFPPDFDPNPAEVEPAPFVVEMGDADKKWEEAIVEEKSRRAEEYEEVSSVILSRWLKSAEEVLEEVLEEELAKVEPDQARILKFRVTVAVMEEFLAKKVEKPSPDKTETAPPAFATEETGIK